MKKLEISDTDVISIAIRQEIARNDEPDTTIGCTACYS